MIETGLQPITAECSAPATRVAAAGEPVQWVIRPDDVFSATGPTCGKLPAGVYHPGQDNQGQLIFSRVRVVTDDLLRLPDTASDRVLEGIRRFWQSEERFRRFGQLFKRGVLLHGPPGSGKTATIALMVNALVESDGVALIAEGNPVLTRDALQLLRRVEPERPLIVIFEDIDALIKRWDESALLNLLDGESQVDNVVHLATTNYPEELDGRIKDRPSRFDEVIEIGMPTPEAREVYLRSKAGGALTVDELREWVEASEGLSVAHLREIVVAVLCLGRDFRETLVRLRGMKKGPKSRDYGRSDLGFAGSKAGDPQRPAGQW